MELTILHTNDVHSRYEAFAKAATAIKELRDENTLVLDAGDFNDFMRLELQGTNGRAGVALLKSAGYDALSVGNNEGFAGIEILETLAGENEVPVLACNLYKRLGEKLHPIKNVKRSIIKKVGGISYLIIGSSPGASFNEFFYLLNMESVDPEEEIEEELKKYAGQYDKCILLSHLGLKKDMQLAEEFKGIDIIIGGHSHTLMEEPLLIKNTLIHQSGNYCEHLGILKVNYSEDGMSFSGKNLMLKDVEPDQDILELLKSSKEEAVSNMSSPLYYIHKTLWHDVVEENPMTNFLADALRDLLSCEIGLINSGVLSGGIKNGAVTRLKLLELCPSPLNPTTMYVKGEDIREALKHSLDSQFCLQEGRGSGFRGRYLGRLHVSGMRVFYRHRKLVKVLVGEEELRDDRWYKIATSDYLKRGTGYNSLANNKDFVYEVDYLRDTLRDYLKRSEFIDEAFVERWIQAE